MRKAWIVAALVLAVVLAVSCGSAEEASVKTYKMAGTGVSVELDADIPVYMAGDQEISEAYTKLKLTKEYMDQLLAENMLNLHALVNNGSRELMINCVNIDIDDLGKLGEEELEALKGNTEAQFVNMGAEIRDSAYVETGVGRALYIHYSYKNGMYTSHVTQYSAIKEGRMVNVRMSSYNSWLNPTEEEWLLKVVNSLKWEEVPESGTAVPEGNTTYHVEGAKLTLEIPTAVPVYCYGDEKVNEHYRARGISKEALDQMMGENGMYLHALVGYGSEMFVIASPLGEDVPDVIADEEYQEMLAGMDQELESAGAKVTSSDLVDTAAGKAFHCIFRIEASGLNQECEQYALISGNSIVILRMSNYSGGLSENEKTLLLDATNSIVWDQ